VGQYESATAIIFTGTAPYSLVFNEGGGITTWQCAYTIPAGKTLKSFTDKTGAPGTFHCTMPATQTLTASAAGYCEDAAGVQFALDGTERDVVYQLYRDNSPLSGATITGGGSAATFSGTFTAGVYRVESLPGASCPAAMDSTHTITMYPVPAPPAITGPEVACNTATLVAIPGDHGSGISWTDVESTNPARIVTTTNTYTAVSTSAHGCQSGSSSFSCNISLPAAAGAAPDPLCCCRCGLSVVSGKCSVPASSAITVPSYRSCNATPLTTNTWRSSHATLYCPITANCTSIRTAIAYLKTSNYAIMECQNATCTQTKLIYQEEGSSMNTFCWN
jgi:hypothetical protein